METYNEPISMSPAVYIPQHLPKQEDDTFHADMQPHLIHGDEVVDLGEDFDFDGFQVVRREFFAHLREPSITFNNCKFYANTACLSRFPDTNCVQVLINRDTKILALRPCEEGARDSFFWCSQTGKRKPRPITCRLFFAKIMSLMGWNPANRYKLLGRVIHANGEYLLAFDLTSTEVYERTYPEGAKPKTSRVPVYPSSWKDQFGLSYQEHKQSMQVNIFEGYAVYSIKDSDHEQSHKKSSPEVSAADDVSSL